MKPKEKNKFIAKTAAKVLAAMYTRPDKDPDPKHAVEVASQLWDELEKQKVISADD